ncbi:MAG: Gfo/Idh/MocA family oxidoreductase [Sinomonas sp.]|nr:Gfo/Idh/MocA family oxidoreductase [Sinomonas sp.]
MSTPASPTAPRNETAPAARDEAERTHQGTEAAPARVALVGADGFGLVHLRNLERLSRAGAVVLDAVADPRPPDADTIPEGTAQYASLEELLAERPAPDLAIVATPLQTHGPLGAAALDSGAQLYLEKPPVPSLGAYRELLAHAESRGAAVQVGFQSLGSHALPAVDWLLESGEIGTLRAVGAMGVWTRDLAHYARSRWAGKRRLDGIEVVDGVVTNPLAHAVATALRLAGARREEDVASIDVDLYHAHNIEADDTSTVRIVTAAGLPITCALTLCATESAEPWVTVYGTEGEAQFFYTEDRLVVRTADGEREERYGRTDLTENLLDHAATGAPLLSSLEDAGAFMRVLEAVRTAPSPRQIPSEFVDWVGEGPAARPIVRGIEEVLECAVRAQATFSEMGLPWAVPNEPTAELSLPDGQVVAELRGGAGIAPTLSPRPYLHPVRTLAGTVVTAHLPLDHPWHLGLGMALQDVSGTNLWGGRTYTREAGRYMWRPDHGRIAIEGTDAVPGRLALALRWHAHDGAALLTEERTAAAAPAGDGAWRLDFSTRLTAARPASLGGPGSNGNAGGGYGGFFLRLAACEGARVFTPDAEGEDAVHGTAAPWIGWSALFGGRSAGIVIAAAPEAPDDPWFVRLAAYPGIGSALAWERAVELGEGEQLARTFRVWFVDGPLDAARAAGLAAGATADGARRLLGP